MLVLAACADPEPPRERLARPEPAPREQAPSEEDALEPPPPSSWPASVDSLLQSVDAFESVDACREDLRARTPTSVAEGLSDLAYEGFFDDVCRALDAVKRGAPEDCDALAASSARSGCRTRIALLHGRASACPAARVMDGPDPLCVAWAVRNADLCTAVAPPEDVVCRAVIAGDERACRSLRRGDRERCGAQVRRYAGALGDERTESPAAREPAVFRLEVGEGADMEILERAVLARGVRAAARGCRYSVALASRHGELALGTNDPTFQLELTSAATEPPIDLPLGAIDAVLSLRTPARGALDSIAGATGRVRIERFDPALGGAFSGTIEGTLAQGETELPVRGRFSTFFRDVEALPDHCAPATQD
jgi:hypothetical protein